MSTLNCPHCGEIDDHSGCCPIGQTNCPMGFIHQIYACKKEVANWPKWMKQTSEAPVWMGEWGWDD